MTRWRRAIHIMISALFAAGCGDLRELPTGPGGGGETPDPSATFTRVKSEIFTPTCAFSGCHGSSGTQSDLNLSAAVAYAQIVNRPSIEVALDRIEPGFPDQSYLYRKVTGGPNITGDRMPIGLPALTEPQLALLRDWIRRGAPND